MKHIRLLFLFLAVFPRIALPENSGGSGAGNGGDILSAYLETTRLAVQRVVTTLKLEPETIKSLCRQQEECVRFLKGTLEQWVRIASETELRVVSDDLEVTRRDGSQRRVDAKTQLGPDGRIDFSYDRIRFYSPRQMMQLLVHELGHKVIWGGSSIRDEKPMDSFASGKDFLDTLGLDFARFAEKEKFLGRAFKLYDIFDCTIQLGEKIPYVVSIEGSSPRVFSSPEQFGTYDVGIGMRNTDARVEISDRLTNSRIAFRFNTHESKGCSDPSDSQARWTEVELVRRQKNNEESLFKQKFLGINPVCSPGISPIRVAYQNFVFECSYVGSSAINQISEPQSGDEL